ncbi:MAG: ATP-binding protein, partial [Pseudomonadota bacterium]|nr:ATP-binding protein [Pseudomonadota bacterium]
MLFKFLYALNVLLLLSDLLIFRLSSGERRYSLSLVRILLALPLLAGEYFYLARYPEPRVAGLMFFSEVVFAHLWFFFALRLSALTTGVSRTTRNLLIEIFIGGAVAVWAFYLLFRPPVVGMDAGRLFFQLYSPVYFVSIFILVAVFYAAWRLEQFWRALDAARRWEYKFLVVGCYLVCGSLAWAASYRLTFLVIVPVHLRLLAVLLTVGWALTAYAVVHYRLLNRKIFVSRKVVYSFVVPGLIAVYLIGFGLLSMVLRLFDLQFSFVLKWLLLALGLVAVGLFAFSSKLRRRVHFFISTHFYINKYEYRDEWLALSQHLQGAMTEAGVVDALRRVLAESLYTSEIFIWVGDSSAGYRLVYMAENHDVGKGKLTMAADDLLVRFVKTHSHFLLREKEPDPAWQEVAKKKEVFLTSLNLLLLAPIAIGDQLVGLIGLGPEYTGGVYGHDDFDLLTVLGSQAASSLLAARMAEKLAHAREQQAWNRLSAFVLHDIKNAATMLSLLRENAPEHLGEPEFQQDMLEVVDDALKRMGRVEVRLKSLKDELVPENREFQLCQLLEDCRRQLAKKLPALKIVLDCRDDLWLESDPELLASVFENLLLNAFESGGEGTCVRLGVRQDESSRQAVIEVADDGPGISPELLPEGLFEPFKTS